MATAVDDYQEQVLAIQPCRTHITTRIQLRDRMESLDRLLTPSLHHPTPLHPCCAIDRPVVRSSTRPLLPWGRGHSRRRNGDRIPSSIVDSTRMVSTTLRRCSLSANRTLPTRRERSPRLPQRRHRSASARQAREPIARRAPRASPLERPTRLRLHPRPLYRLRQHYQRCRWGCTTLRRPTRLRKLVNCRRERVSLRQRSESR